MKEAETRAEHIARAMALLRPMSDGEICPICYEYRSCSRTIHGLSGRFGP